VRGLFLVDGLACAVALVPLLMLVRRQLRTQQMELVGG
jgi:formate-dependent nitrite reductase membrane component NrfD